jgi:hypothetical protein
MGEAGARLLGELQGAIRARLGAPGEAAGPACDAMTQAVARYWPVALMTDAARRPETAKAGADTLAAVNVVSAKCREELEARADGDPASLRAIDLLIRAVVVEFARVWFSSARARLDVCRCIALVRSPD